MKKPKISICIPAYKRTFYLQRLLDSISTQTFRDFEVILTDDSPTDEVFNLYSAYTNQFTIYYKKNRTALGTPANWNCAISLAKGEWIKLMHDDDWFSDENSLAQFAGEAEKGSKFIFSAYTNFFETTQKKEDVSFPRSWSHKIIERPLVLMAQNVIGPPSVTMVHNSIKEQYDTRMKWRVDIDYYIRVLKIEKAFSVIDMPLINVGIGVSQVTNDCFNLPEVELPEAFLMLEKYGLPPLKNITVYDAWWRMFRNLLIRNKNDLMKYTPNRHWPDVIMSIAKHQSFVPHRLMKLGIVSKFFMFISYLTNRKFLK
jgi:glycosyltransferase involved in cell wall biosynthesis